MNEFAASVCTKEQRKTSNQIKIYKIYFHYYSQNNALYFYFNSTLLKLVRKNVIFSERKAPSKSFFKIYFMTISVCIIKFVVIFQAKVHEAHLVRLFDAVISPRCYALIVNKDIKV